MFFVLCILLTVWKTLGHPREEDVSAATMSRSSNSTISSFHWNPHWQCFDRTNPSCVSTGCSSNALSALDSLLRTGSYDFGHVIELEESSWAVPHTYDAIGLGNASCGDDWDTLFYDRNKWKLRRSKVGCVVPHRSFAIGEFEYISNSDHDGVSTDETSIETRQEVVTVLGVHFPQTINASTGAYDDTIASLRNILKTFDTSFVLFMADTNTESPAAASAGGPSHHGVNRTNREMFIDLGLWSPNASDDPPSAPLFRSCCENDDFQWQGDRIIASSGRLIASNVLFDDVPAWAECDDSEFHKGVAVTIGGPQQ